MKIFIGKYPKNFRVKRKVNVKIHDYDIWNMDSTLALIIYPMLKKMRDGKHGAPVVDDKDVPKELRSTAAPKTKNDWDTDDNWHKRWDWILAEMTWTFEQHTIDWEDKYHSGVIDFISVPLKGKKGWTEMKKGPKDTWKFDRRGYDKHCKRIQRGMCLFGKYYTALWT